MKKNILIAAILAALFLAPFFTARAEAAPAFTADENQLLQGMSRTWLQGYEPDVSKGRWVMILPVRSETATGAVTAELVLPRERTSPFRPQTTKVTAREETSGVWGVRFSLAVFDDRKNGDYPCVIRLKGKDREGKEISEEIPYTVRIRGCKEDAEKARIQVSEVSAALNVGERGEVQITLTNPCAASVLEDVELKVSAGASHILPREAETMRVGNIGIGESVIVTYPVTVVEKASVAPHVLKLDMSWTALGKAGSQAENHTVSVRQEIRLEQGGVKMAREVTAGDSMTVTLPLMNMGKADVVNVLATVSMPGITERQSVLVGTIQPGETKQAQLILSPAKDAGGEFTGTLEVECTDQDGNPSSFTLPLELKVNEYVEKARTEEADSAAVRKSGVPALTYGLGGGCGILLTAFLLQGFLLRRKLHRMEEARL